MTTNTLYLAAIENMNQSGEYYGNSRHSLANGDVVICSIKKVAGCSVVAKHYRTNFLILRAAAQYSKPISRSDVIALLKAEAA